MYLVTGATGKTGSAVANHLLDQGLPTRVYVRSADKATALADRGAAISVGTLQDADALARALDGTTAAYLMLPYDERSDDFIADGRQLAAGYAAAVATAGTPRIVGLSSIAAHKNIGPMAREHAFEAAFHDHPGARFLRPAYFVENWAGALAATQAGILPTFLRPDVPVAMVAAADIGQTAADLLVAEQAPRVTELAGPADLSPTEAAAAVAKITGTPVAAHPLPLDQVAATFTEYGFSRHIADLVQDMYAAYAADRITFEGQPVRAATPIEKTLRALLSAPPP